MHLPFSAPTRTGLDGKSWTWMVGSPRARRGGARGRDRFQVGRGGGMVETKRGSRRVGFPAAWSTRCEATAGGIGRSRGTGVPSGSRSKPARWLEPSRPEVAGMAMPPPARKAGGGPGSRTPRRSGGGGAPGWATTGSQGVPAVPAEGCNSPPGAAMAAAPANRTPTRRRSLALTRRSWSRKRASLQARRARRGGRAVSACDGPTLTRRNGLQDRSSGGLSGGTASGSGRYPEPRIPPGRPGGGCSWQGTLSVFRHSTRTFNIMPTSSCSRMWQWRG
jgi:hypothetical protein